MKFDSSRSDCNKLPKSKIGYRKSQIGGFIFRLRALLQVLFVLTITVQTSHARRPDRRCDDFLLKQKNAQFFDGFSEEEYKRNREASLKRRLETVPSAPAPRTERHERVEKAKESYRAEREARQYQEPSRYENARRYEPSREARPRPNPPREMPVTRAPVPAKGREERQSSDLRDRLHDEVRKNHMHVLGYREAREVIMGTLNYHNDSKGSYVWDVYCQKPFPIHEGEMPSPNELNIEHTWPQSKFTNRFPPNVQKSDLHHLFPTDSMANGLRGHMTFGEVVRDTKQMPCAGIHVGLNTNGEIVFEGPAEHKGDMARAIFYFAVRYQMDIDPREEAALRKWNQEDPVSPEEMARNDKIEKIQGNRNPFVDHPEYVEQIANF